MKRKLYIHAGPPKTGTSAFQYVLRDHDGSVVHYPKAGQWGDGSHHNLVLNFFGELATAQAVREDDGALFDRVAAGVRNSQGPVVISSEMLSARGDPGDFIQALLLHLGGDFDVEILFIIRDHFERAASLYGQRVQSQFTRETRGPDEYLTQQASVLCYAPMLLRLLETGFSMRLIDYNPSDDLVPRLLRHIGFPDESIAAPPTRNPSRAIKLLLITLVANRITSSPPDRQKIVRTLGKLRQSFAPARFIFGHDAATAAERKFGHDRAFLRKRFKFEVPAPDLTTVTNAFFIDEDEIAEISERVATLGGVGEQLCADLRAFVRLPAP